MDPSKHAPLRIIDIRSKYKVIDKVGKGTYGTVYKVLNLQDNKFYAIKKFQNTEAKLQVQGFPITALRQISLLKQLNHPHIVNLKEIICSKPNRRNLYRGSTFMVFEYMHHDFAGLFRSKINFSTPEIKSIMKQLIQGCSFLHQNKVMHRDIKSANILLNDQGIVQLADFGLGRRTRFESVYTYKVVTLWYRAPQLLLGCKTYNHKVDVWSIGCVFAELLTGQVLFKKQTQYAIIQKIYQICGDLQENQYTEEYLRGCVYYNDMKPKRSYKNTLGSFIRKICPNIDSLTVQFLQGLLQLNPYKRLSCEQALDHEFFKQQPKACNPQKIQKLDVQYHQMFKDRSLKIDRKQRKQSLDWSEQEERRKIKSEPKIQKSYKDEKKDTRPYVRDDRKPYNDRNYDRRYPDIRNDRYQERKYDNTRRQSSTYKRHDDYKPRRKYTRSASNSQSSSSSSNSKSKRSRTRDNKRNNYGSRDETRPYKKQGYTHQRQRSQVHSVKKDNGSHLYSDKSRDKYEQRDKAEYNSSKRYEQKIQSYKKDDSRYLGESRFYKEKNYDFKDRNRKQSDYGDKKYENSRYKQRYSKQDYDRSYQKNSGRDRDREQGKLEVYRNQKYQGEYRGKRDDHKSHEKGERDSYSKRYVSRDSRQYSEKQYQQYSYSQKNNQERGAYVSRERQYRKDRQYRDNDKSSYGYQRNQSRKRDDSGYKQQSRSKDYQYKNVSISSRQSAQRKKHLPQKKDIEIEEY